MNRKITTLLPLLLFLLCNSSCVQTGGNKILDKEKQYDIHLVKARMVFPDFFRATTFEQLSHELDLADNLEVADTARKRHIKELLSGTNYFLLADTTDPYSNISIFPINHVLLDKLNTGMYLSQMQKEMEADIEEFGTEFTRLENKLMNGPNSQMLKLRFKLYNSGVVHYFTHYVITTKQNSFTVNIRTFKDIDFDYFMSKMGFIK